MLVCRRRPGVALSELSTVLGELGYRPTAMELLADIRSLGLEVSVGEGSRMVVHAGPATASGVPAGAEPAGQGLTPVDLPLEILLVLIGVLIAIVALGALLGPTTPIG